MKNVCVHQESGRREEIPKYISSIFIGYKPVNPEKEGIKEGRVFCMKGMICAKEQK